MNNSDNNETGLSVEEALRELREMFPDKRLNIRQGVNIWWWPVDRPEPVHQQVGGWYIGFHVPSIAQDFGAYGHIKVIGSALTFDEAMAQVRAWREKQTK